MNKELTGEPKRYFDLCFGYDKLISENILGNYTRLFQDKYDYEEFKRIAIKTLIEPYYPLLWMYIAFNRSNIIEQSITSIEKKSIKAVKDNIDLIQTLLFFFEADIDQTTCTLRDTKTICKITSSLHLETIRDSLLLRFKESKMQYSKYTFEEAKEAILKLQDITWVQQYCKNHYTDYEYFISEFGEPDWDNPEEYITDDMIEDYAYDHDIEREITKELLLNRLQGFKSRLNTKPGAKPKNNRIAVLAIKISYLIRLREFILDDNIIDISKMQLKNAHCRLIYECLRYFNLIDDVNNRGNSTTPESYIKALINNYYKQTSGNRSRVVDRINSYKSNNEEILPF